MHLSSMKYLGEITLNKELKNAIMKRLRLKTNPTLQKKMKSWKISDNNETKVLKSNVKLKYQTLKTSAKILVQSNLSLR